MPVAAPSLGCPEPSAPLEANVKAVFLYNFTKYVTWPPLAPGERQPAEMRICVTANDAFFALLKVAVQGEDIDGRPLLPDRARRPGRCADVSDPVCGRFADARCQGVARPRCAGSQVLTVADGPLNDETVITFVRDEQPHPLRHQPRIGGPARPEYQLKAAAPGASGEGPVMFSRLSIRQKLTADADADQLRACCCWPRSRS